MWVNLIMLLVSSVVSAALAPKPPKPEAATIEDVDIPTADEGKEIPVVFGEVEIKNANVLWYGDLRVTDIVADAGKKGEEVTVGYWYSLGYHVGVCYGPVDYVKKISVGEIVRCLDTPYEASGQSDDRALEAVLEDVQTAIWKVLDRTKLDKLVKKPARRSAK